MITILYNAASGPLARSQIVKVHLGWNNWKVLVVTDQPMDFSREKDRWECTLPIVTGAKQLDCVFTDGTGTWDNNDHQDWHFPLADTLRKLEDCAICLEPIQTMGAIPPGRDIEPFLRTDGLLATVCAHLFHEDCLRRWRQQPGGLRCPLCRQKDPSIKSIEIPNTVISVGISAMGPMNHAVAVGRSALRRNSREYAYGRRVANDYGRRRDIAPC